MGYPPPIEGVPLPRICLIYGSLMAYFDAFWGLFWLSVLNTTGQRATFWHYGGMAPFAPFAPKSAYMVIRRQCGLTRHYMGLYNI